MANLSQILELSQQLNQKDRAAIIALIDVKTEGDMQAVLNKLDTMSSQLNSRFEAITARIDGLETKMGALETKMDARIDALETKMDARIDALETKMDARIDALDKSISQIKWIVGIIVALAVAASRLLPFV